MKARALYYFFSQKVTFISFSRIKKHILGQRNYLATGDEMKLIDVCIYKIKINGVSEVSVTWHKKGHTKHNNITKIICLTPWHVVFGVVLFLHPSNHPLKKYYNNNIKQLPSGTVLWSFFHLIVHQNLVLLRPVCYSF